MRRVVAVEDGTRVVAKSRGRRKNKVCTHFFATWRNPEMIIDHNKKKIYENSIIIINISSSTVLYQ